MKYNCSINGKMYEVVIEKVDDFTPLTYEQVAGEAPIQSTPAPTLAETAKPVVSSPTPAPVAPTKVDTPKPAPAAAGGSGSIKAPMPGKIMDIQVSVGQSISSGDTVLCMEAMKMETEIVSDLNGTVKEICVKSGDMVETDQVLITIG